ncbi:Transcription elongation factor spt6, partial [Ascosphaera aggregata]
KSKFKRLKRGHKAQRKSTEMETLFSSDEENEINTYEESYHRPRGRTALDDLDGFIEEDVFSDEEVEQVQDEDMMERTARKGISSLAVTEATGLDEATLEDMRLAFGDGTDYLFALEAEEQAEEEELSEEKHVDLKDVFEPSQLAERFLTDEDAAIRATDVPERYQLARAPFKHLLLTEDQFREETGWIANAMLLKRHVDPDLEEPFRRSVAKVLEFMVHDEWEVPFIFQHRKDYLIHASKIPVSPDPQNPDAAPYQVKAEKLLNMMDLWDIFELDLKFRALIDKRNALQKAYDSLQGFEVKDELFERLIASASSMEELQDLQDYLYFKYPAQLRDIAAIDRNGRRKTFTKSLYERFSASRAFQLVKAFGITAHAFAENVMKQGGRTYTEDRTERPEDMADSLLDSYFSTGSHALKTAKTAFAEDLYMSPELRKVVRNRLYPSGVVNCHRTEKGVKNIDEQHPYYEFKYLRNLPLSEIARRPELFLRMLKAEEEGLVGVNVVFEDFDAYKEKLYSDIESDNQSELADAWNRERRDVLDMAFARLNKLLSHSVKENLRTECENWVAKECREALANRLDQAPYKPKGMVLGTVPRVLAITNGKGVLNRDDLYWAWVEEDGRVLENGKFKYLSLGHRERGVPDGKDIEVFIEVVERRRPDVIGVSGCSPETRKLHRLLADIVDAKDLRGASYTDENDKEVSDPLEVVIVNDEVAQLYKTSKRAKMEHPGFGEWTNYCVALAKYLQSPMKEYASLKKDIATLPLAKGQQLVPQDKLLKYLESALVDMVNLCGVDINEAITDTNTANLLPYVCGLGPRKAAHLLKIANMNGGTVNNRLELLGVNVQYHAMGIKVWNNCASFLYIEYDSTDVDADYLDNTRVHPEDYDIARKMAADALELDEEDIKAETDVNGQGAIVKKLVKEDAQDRVNDLILEEYAEQLEKNLNQRKRATLETIRAELQQPYEELRKQFVYLSSDAIFTMLTGETHDSLAEGMIVPLRIIRVGDGHIDGRLMCGIDALVPEGQVTDRYDVPVRSLYAPQQTVPAKVLSLNRKSFLATVSVREDQLNRPYQKDYRYAPDEWDFKQEDADKEAMQAKTEKEGRAVRVIKHPLFRPFNAKQAENFLSTQARGDAVIRPSSKGPDHLAVTWKVSDGIYQHIDVLELDKDNEYSVGRILRVGGKYSYSDLDELFVNHVQTMARKINDMMRHEKYQSGTKEATEKWLQTYTQANPTRSAYAFCIDSKHPGYFHLCFQAGPKAPLGNWPVKVIPQGYELRKTPYPDMMSLCNGFKTLFSNMQRNAPRTMGR